MIFSPLIPLVPALLPCDANCIISGIILFIRWRHCKQDVTCLTVIWCCWHQCEYNMILMALLMPPFCFLGQDDWNKVQHNCFVMWYQHWHHMTQMTSIAPLHWLAQDDWYQMLSDLFSHVTLASASLNVNSTILFIVKMTKTIYNILFYLLMTLILVSVSLDVNSVINGTITFVRSKLSKEDAMWHFGHVMTMASASCDANGLINITSAFI